MAAFSLCPFLLLFSCLFLTSNFIMLSQPARQIPPFPPFSFLVFFFFATQGWIFSHLLKLIFLRFLSHELNYLLFIPACLSAAIHPLPVRDQDPSIHHFIIIIFGSFPNLSISPLKSVICSLHSTSSVIFQHFIFTIHPEPQALWHF